ncbi:NAC domain-containing protein 83-like [Mangifera indica]|uniref:NAC domain-containing protein 83-like n=1 Tax=Mangifera indica TaxID=29780 RepID=UPI001CFAFEB1|nr:NAC domain-containing protein 83-like [Mangifera indica]
MIPTGFRFNPTDEELIDILKRKVCGQEMPLHDRFIVERNIYELDPRDFHWDHTVVLPNNERYCYYMRETDSREVPGRGWWRATGHVKKINGNSKNVVGYKRPLTFIRFKDSERKRKNAFKTNWIMHEYSLDSNTTEWRLCKIKYKGKASVKEEMENIRKGFKLMTSFESSSPSIMVMELDFVDEEQQQQSQLLKLENNFHETHDSMDMEFHFLSEEQEKILQVPQALQLNGEVMNDEHSFRQNMQIMDDQQQDQQQSNASYDPILTHISNSDYYFYNQMEHPDSSEELFPSLWNW